MSDENKNVENKQEENQNREECNKKWWKNVGLKPNLQADVIGGFTLGICCLCLFIYIDNFKFK